MDRTQRIAAAVALLLLGLLALALFLPHGGSQRPPSPQAPPEPPRDSRKIDPHGPAGPELTPR